jgi:L-lactate dehydrogenase complex protein LldE
VDLVNIFSKIPDDFHNNGRNKCASALDTGAEFIASCDSSCLMHLQGLITRQNKNIKTIHIAEILAQQ